MKKSIALMLVALAVLSVSASGFLDDFKDGENYVPDHVYLFTGNDLFSYGVTRNDDDQLLDNRRIEIIGDIKEDFEQLYYLEEYK